MKKLIVIIGVLFGMTDLAGCGSTSSSSTPVSSAYCTQTGTGTYVNASSGALCNCVYNGSTGQYTDTNSGALCSGSGYATGIGTTGCEETTSGYYINPTTGLACTSTTTIGGSCILSQTGVYVSTTTGQICATSGIPTVGVGSSNPCSYWSSIYPGNLYEPSVLNGQLVCVNVSGSQIF